LIVFCLVLLFLRLTAFPQPREHLFEVLLYDRIFRRRFEILHVAAETTLERLQADVKFEIRSTLRTGEHTATAVVNDQPLGALRGGFREGNLILRWL
jgi:hypothetical protein